ncbi:MAG TPA: lysylphosphatidylglycerol synthase domain-containing protein [Longimicrobiales bacterium]|nr:lysylphosphatidylglycerol synthase domain-containing protein [Longimicrobiales bacterium]
MSADPGPAGRPAPRGWKARLKRIEPILDLLLFGVALAVLDRILSEYSWPAVLHELRAIPPGWLLLALLLTALGYLALVGYDFVAFRFIGRPLPFRRVFVPSFVSYAVANSAPVSVLTGGGVRYKMYSGLGLTAAETAAVAAFDVVTYTLGLLTVAGVTFVLSPIPTPAFLHVPVTTVRPLGAFCLLVVAAYLTVCLLHLPAIEIRGHRFRLPGPGIAVGQLGVSGLDWMLSATALYVLLQVVGNIPYGPFLASFLLAQIVSLVFPLPGGIGVFETIVLLLRPAGASAPAMLGALLAYRFVYYLLPLGVAGVLLVLDVRRRRAEGAAGLAETVASLAPTLLALLVFLAGAVLLVTGTFPAGEQRLRWLGTVLPLGVVRASAFLGSVLGGALLLLAWGLQQRLDAAYQVTRVLVVLGVLSSLLRGFDFRAAAVMTIVLAILLPARREFDRESAIIWRPLTMGWLAAVAAVLLAVVWLDVFVRRHVGYAAVPWWKLALSATVPATLRLAVGFVVVVLMAALIRLFRPARKR